MEASYNPMRFTVPPPYADARQQRDIDALLERAYALRVSRNPKAIAAAAKMAAWRSQA
jgi:hypothetical protein